ncbi:hypothetical protein GRX03_02700 [Halovenus sp. WSH3]|uniref:DUF4352 domain-containing protein n=1 Tax=Halovenus carboxidivorans TaxID=2692199 RepID=A0A6B0SZT6_9EURY|nr:hypothetical protein [Halovenus carboxidivorans]MXR50517.1 hypothetical protein [Halovenus carboxidivorans]
MSEDDDAIEPYDRSRRPRSTDGRPSPPATDSGDATDPTRVDDSRPRTDSQSGPETLADAVSRTATSPTTVESRSVSATLVGVPQIDLRDFVYAHQLDPGEDDPRQVALFDIENRTDQRLRWRSARTKFIGTDEYTYGPAQLSLEPAQLGPGCHTRQVELEPNSKARMVTLVERLPRGVEVAKVVQTIPRRGAAQNERLVFAVE